MPNSTNATKTDSSVKIVRTFRRQQVAPDEREELHATTSVDQRALLEVQRPLRPRGGVRVVRDHDDRLAVLAVERLQQVEDLVAGLAIEVAGRLVAQQQRRVGDDRAGDADALLLAAGELPRVVLRAVGEADDRQRDAARASGARPSTASSAAAAARRCARRSAPAAGCRTGRRSRRAARATPTAGRPTACRCDRRRRRSIPSVGVSRPPIRLSSVVLPEPDGPISARKSPVGMSRLTPCSTSMRSLPRLIDLVQIANLDQRVHSTLLDRDSVAVLHAPPAASTHHPLAGGDARHDFDLVAFAWSRP